MSAEFKRFVEYIGGNTKTSKVLNCTPDMVRKMKTGERGIKKPHVQTMYRYKGFRLSFLALFDLN